MRRWLAWAGLAACVFAGGNLLDLIGLPSAYLFAALLIGLAVALAKPGRMDVSEDAFRASQAVAGVTLGAYLQSDALSALADSWLPVLFVSAATLGLSLAAGVVLGRTTPLDGPTASLGMIAGGASGIVGMSGELGADDRLVAFMQYLRVLIVVLVTPIGIAIFFGGQHGSQDAVIESSTFGDPLDWVLTLALSAVGVVIAERAKVTAGVLLGPMILTGALVLSGALGDFAVPDLVSQVSFAVIGIRVGLRFTPATVRLLGRLTVPVLIAIAGLLAGSFGLALILDATTSASLLDSYLATTPGGLYAVVAVAFGAGANTTFIVAVQTLRVFAMILLAPLAVRWTLRRV